ncbi:MAG: alpha/beta fold hydrolase [Nevskia sp.]|nr:alpha/beta fold hydrolase [Nevskia sp.]
MSHWHRIEAGHGRPLVLLHGIGMSHAAWKPVVPLLAKQRRVLAFDVAGFGRSAPLPAGTTPNQHNLVAALGATLRYLGITDPVDFAGNSMGGMLAIEAARQGLARSVVALSPGGLWTGRTPPGLKASFDLMRRTIRRAPRLSEALLRAAPMRSMLLAVPMSAASWRMPAEEAVHAARNFVAAPAFDETFASLGTVTGAHSITVPLTVAFGTRDWLLTRRCQNRKLLPEHTRWLRPRGWGHVPMWDDPTGVAELILEGTR